MGSRCWLGLALVVALAAPSSPGGDVAVTERQAAHMWAPCPQDDGGAAAEEEERRLTPMYSPCMLRCASQAFWRTVSSKKTLILNEGRPGEEHEFCWELRLRSHEGERLTKAFVFLNLEQPPDGSQPPPYRLLLTTPPAQHQHLRPRPGNWTTRLLSTEACGAHFDVTEPFLRAEGCPEAEMCVKAVCPKAGACEAVRLHLQCPPFLATLWRSLPQPDG